MSQVNTKLFIRHIDLSGYVLLQKPRKQTPQTDKRTPCADLCDARASEGHDDGHNVNGELKLEKLGDAVIDVPAPHHCFDDAAEVIVCEDNI